MSPEVNYQNSKLSPADADLLTRVGIAFALRQRSSLRRIVVVIDQGQVTLRGQLPSFFDKQLAIETSRRVAGVRLVQDELTVQEVDSVQELPPHQPTSRTTTAVALGNEAVLSHQEKDSSMFGSARLPVVATVTFVRIATLMAICLTGLLTGCSSNEDRLKVYPVEGQITFNGKPLANALVVLHPKDTSNPKLMAARGQTDKSGSFKVSTYDTYDGAPVGSYAVTVQYYPLLNKGNGGFEPGPNALSPRIASPQTTDIVVEVAANPNKLPPLEVRR